MRWLWPFAWLTACGGGQAPVTVVDTGVEVSVESDAGPGSGIPRCGPGPWLVHREQAFKGWGDRAPVADVPVKLDACPDLEIRADATGEFKFAFTYGQPYDLLYGLPGQPPQWQGRWTGILPIISSLYYLEPKPGAPRDPNAVALKIQTYTDGGRAAPCNNRFGIRVSVLEHPEAKTHYWINDVETDSPDDLRLGEITVDGLPADVDVTVVASKPGCVADPYFRPERAKKTRTHRGYFTQVDVEIRGPEGDAGK